MKILSAKNTTFPFFKHLGKKLAKTAIREVSKTDPGKRAKKLFELEDVSADRPSRVISGALGTADKAVNLAVRPFGKRKKRSWRHMYEDKWQRDEDEELNEGNEGEDES
jgi:hypothetical protein